MKTQMIVSAVFALLIVAAIVVGVLYATGVIGKTSSAPSSTPTHLVPRHVVPSGPHPYTPNPDGPVPHESGTI